MPVREQLLRWFQELQAHMANGPKVVKGFQGLEGLGFSGFSEFRVLGLGLRASDVRRLFHGVFRVR